MYSKGESIHICIIANNWENCLQRYFLLYVTLCTAPLAREGNAFMHSKGESKHIFIIANNWENCLQRYFLLYGDECRQWVRTEITHPRKKNMFASTDESRCYYFFMEGQGLMQR